MDEDERETVNIQGNASTTDYSCHWCNLGQLELGKMYFTTWNSARFVDG
jgi:hypothetical protein